MAKKKQIAIIGFGRFGKLLADILSPSGNIFVVSSHKLKDKKITQIELVDLSQMDWVIPAVPISGLADTLKKINPHLRKGSLVMDVCSVKVWPCRWLKKYIRKDVEIMGTHPMFGPDSAKNGTKGLQMVICPLRQSGKTLAEVRNIFRKMGLKIIETTPEDHDRQVAKSLALVHFIGRGLSTMKIEKQDVTTLGFERLLAVNETVANDSWQLFLDMHHFNPYAEKVRESFGKALVQIEKIINQERNK